jgi:hypothetical protein
MSLMLSSWSLLLVSFGFAVTALAQDPEKPFPLSPLQQQLADAQKKWVVAPDDRPAAQRNYFRLKTLSFDPRQDVAKQIEKYENSNRRGYDAGPFEVLDATGKLGDESGWETWCRDIFTIEQNWAQGLRTPYFCQVLHLETQDGKSVQQHEISEEELRRLSQNTVRAILKPVTSHPETELQSVPIFVVRYIGNFEGNAKYVKFYLGKPGTADFVVLDVSVYDHY